MTPKEYLDSYQTLKIVDRRLGINAVAKIERYATEVMVNTNKFGCYQSNNSEWCAVVDLLQRKFFPPKTKLPPIFKLAGSEKLVDPSEEFYEGSLHRAYQGRGSPDEIIDATRLAVLAGRIKPKDAAKYAEVMFGVDCNAFVGNYLGCSPSTAIFAYVSGYGSKNPPGATADVLRSKAFVKCPPRSAPEDISAEDILITYEKSASGSPWSHIALVDAIELNTSEKPGKPGETAALVGICEWGQAGDQSKHYTAKQEATLIVGKNPANPKEDIVGFSFHGHMRYFFDASWFSSVPARGWGVVCDSKKGIALDV